ncbi:hypothetical protein GCM10028857_03070 [Salinarchaeum chitinilyticum]
MSEQGSSFQTFGFDRDPFETTIADEEIASQYAIVGRDEQEYRLNQFVEKAILDPDHMKKRLIFGDYGTGKSHHLIKLRNSIREGVEVEGEEHEAIAVYLGNLGLSIRHLYEKIVEEIKDSAPELGSYIDELPSVEPESSVDEAYEFEKLRDNIIDNTRKIVRTAREDHGYRCVYLFIDEAEDIANADEDKVQPFVRAFLHLVNELNSSGIHMLLGFSQGARMKITNYDDEGDSLGNALMERFQGGEIYLGHLSEDDVKEMLTDRMDHHRTSNSGSLTPIAEETVSVVAELAGGHPREILRIYSEALQFAAEVDSDRIDGDAIVYALTGFKSFVREEDILSQEAITSLKKALDEVHPDARDDFERLQGRLIGEGEAVPEKAFSEGVADALLSPITVEGEETSELRVLEQRERHGQYSYLLSEAVREFLFGDAGGEGTELQQLDLQASSAPEKYQKHLSRGLGLSIQETGHGNLHKDSINKALDRYEFSLYLIDMRRGDARRDQTVALGVYNGQEIPQELVSLYVEAMEDKGASFGVLVKQNQQYSAEANKYISGLTDRQRQKLKDRVIEIDLTTDLRDSFIYGRLLALGDPETDADEEVNEGRLVEQLDIVPQLESLFEEEILPYPESIHRKVIDKLEERSDSSVTIGDLRDELGLKDYELNSDIMSGLQAQNLVAKDSHRWTYPDVENDHPPWHEVYKQINESGPLTVNEIQERLASKFAFDCPGGDENSMLQWYLDHLQRQNYVEPDTDNRDGKTIDVYTVVSVSDQYNEELGRAKDRLDTAEGLYERADDLDVSSANSYENTLNDLQARLEKYDEIFNPEHNDLNGVRGLIDEIVELEEDIESAVEDAEEQIIGEAKNLRDHRIDDLQREINESDVTGSFSTRLDELDEKLREYREELDELINNEKHVRLKTRTDEINGEVENIENNVDEITGLKTRCTEKYSDVRDKQSAAEKEVKDISQQNAKRSDLESKLSTLGGYLKEYQDEYNNGDFEEALNTLDEEAEPLADEIKRNAGEIVSDQSSYLDQLDDLEKQAESADDKDRRVNALNLIEDAREETNSGNFAEIPIMIEDIGDLLEGPSPREVFLSDLREADGNFGEVIENSELSVGEAFSFLRKTYGDEVSAIQAEFRSGGD